VGQESDGFTSWKVEIPLQPEQLYYWRVMTNDDGYSDTWSFSVTPFTHAYPNPVCFTDIPTATFTDLPSDGELLLTSISGSVIRQWSDLTGQDIVWDGTNESGNRVSSGIYLWYVPTSGAKGKLIVVN